MKFANYIASLNAQFIAKAADITRLSDIDETFGKMLADPQRNAAAKALQNELFDKIDVAFSNKVADLAQTNQSLPSETALRLLASDVFEELAFANPNILLPLLKRDVDIYLNVVLAAESVKSLPNPNRGPT